MSDGLLHFEASVPADGYEWREGTRNTARPGSGTKLFRDSLPRLTPVKGGPGLKVRWRAVSPLDNPALFREFAGLNANDPEQVRQFVGRNGPLWPGTHECMTGKPDFELFHAVSTPVDALHVEPMRRAVQLWEWAAAGDGDSLDAHFARFEQADDLRQWLLGRGAPDTDRPGSRSAPWDGSLPAVPGSRLTLDPPGANGFRGAAVRLAPVAAGGPVGNALAWVAAACNDQTSHCSPTMSLAPGDPPAARLRMVPDSLLAAMWVQFAQAVAGDKRFRSCKDCGKWFEVAVGEDGRTNRRLFCSDACKLRTFRARQRRALALAADGHSAEAIAADLDTDLKTVRGWLAAGK